MPRRSYRQYCTLAEALDVVGERWTLLIVRDLLLGPKRFSDLLEGLPGIGRNLLASRLRHLEAEGLVQRRILPPPGAARVYELTEEGQALRPAMTELSRWGVRRLGEPGPDRAFRPAWAIFPLSYMADLRAARGVRESYEFRVDHEVLHLRVDDGSVEPYAGAAHDPALVATLSGRTMLGLLAGNLAPAEAISAGLVKIEGEPAALERCLSIVAPGAQTASASVGAPPRKAAQTAPADQ